MNTTEQYYHIAIAADRNFSVPLALTCESILRHAKQAQRYHIHILGVDIEEQIASEIQEMCSEYQCGYSYHDVVELLRDVSEREHFPSVAFGRFLLPSLVPNHIDTALYLDADIMINRDIDHLFEMDLGDNLIAGVQDLGVSIYPEFREYIARLRSCFELTENQMPVYYNSGQLLMNLRLWRAEKVADKCLSMGRHCEFPYLYPDQDIMNVCCAGRGKTLPPCYSVVPHFFNIYKKMIDGTLDQASQNVYTACDAQEAMANPALFHFLTTSKPFVLYPPICGYKPFYQLWRSSRWKSSVPFVPKKFNFLALEEKVLKYRLLYKLMYCLCHIPFGYELWWAFMRMLPKKRRLIECKKLDWRDPDAS